MPTESQKKTLRDQIRYAAALRGIFTFKDLSKAIGYCPNRVSNMISGINATRRARLRLQNYLGVHLWEDLPAPDADSQPQKEED